MSDKTLPVPVVEDPWAHLRRFTAARIGLGHAGISLPTQPLLEFQLAHARAQDAVHQALDVANLASKLAACDWYRAAEPPLSLHSAAVDRAQYLQRPDLGRCLDDASTHRLQQHVQGTPDLVISVLDGLSARAIEDNALPFLNALVPQLQSAAEPWVLAPLCIVEQGRVALGDAIGECLQARCALVMIGERPGLSSPDSLGLYLTWQPQVGKNDAQRNCISNIRPAGLSYAEAARRALYLLNEARSRQLSGVQLKDRTEESEVHISAQRRTFLTDR